MNRLLTAVGHLHIERRNKDGKIPVVILKNREYILDIQEFVVWSSLNWRILRPDQIRELYQKKELETGFYSSRSFDDCICRLIQRGLVAEGCGDTEVQALYRLPCISYRFRRIHFFVFALSFGSAFLERFLIPQRKRYFARTSERLTKRK